MNEIQIFSNAQFGDVRTLEINGEPWFIGKEIAKILGYERADNAIRNHVDDEDKLMHQISASGQNRNMYLINESGLYSLILSSKLPSAKAFKRWVTSEVLPAIHKHGAYMTDKTIEEALENPDILIELATKLKNEKMKRAKLEEQAKANESKVIFANAVSVSSTSILVGELAKLLTQNGVPNMGQNKLFRFLRENGYLIKLHRNDYNMPTQKAMNAGLFEIKESVIQHSDGHTTISKTVKVTGKGQIYFINLFLKNGGEI